VTLYRWLVLGACAAGLLGCVAQPAASLPARQVQAKAESPAGLSLVPLEIRSGKRIHRFTVEVAASAEQQQRGLMFRKRVGPNAGMIFPFARPDLASFWMKNTVIPLDIIFIRADGTIANIAVNTIPYSLDNVRSKEPVIAVLELAGGRTVELGIKENDRVIWRRP
jgi:uncharacterized membrane protein (UPF0127 family)